MTLEFILSCEKMTKKMLEILKKCKGVVVCRASPSQKASVVNLIK